MRSRNGPEVLGVELLALKAPLAWKAAVFREILRLVKWRTTYTLTLNEIAVYDLPTPSNAKLSAVGRDEILEKVIVWKVANRKLQVEQRSEHQVILVRKRWTGREHRESISVR